MTGQISGFTTMADFKRRFGEHMGNGEYGFSNVRNGLIVGLVRLLPYTCPSNLEDYS